MIAQNYGRIVNIASVAGKEGNPNASAYSVSKAGVIGGLTKSLGKELAGYDIAVNAITPAAAKTAIFDQMKQETHRLHAVEDFRARAFSSRSRRSPRSPPWCAFGGQFLHQPGAVFDISGGAGRRN